jgi:hypothetical protein
MALDEKLSLVVENQFPSFYKEEGAKFLQFVKAYYEYMEQQGKASDALMNLESYKDINTTLDEYFEYFRKTLLPSVPDDIAADKRLFAKYIHDFNQSRGTLNSLRLLFRALYNEDVEVYFPGQQILKVSDGEWRKERYIVAPYEPQMYSFIGKTIVGQESAAEALVEDVVKIMARSRDIMKLILSNVKGDFKHDEPISVKGVSGGFSPIIEAGINKITIQSGGENYARGDVLTLESDKAGIFGKGVVIDIKSTGGVLSFDLVDGGSGYTATDSLGGTKVQFIGGDGFSEASFEIDIGDIQDTFAISVNTNKVGSNNIFGDLAPHLGANNKLMSTHANTPIGCPHYGFPEYGEEVTKTNFHDQANALITIANTSTITVGDSLFGNTTSANAYVKSIIDNTAGSTIVKINGYKKFSTGEHVHINLPSGSDIGTVTTYEANTAGSHPLQIGYFANNITIQIGDTLRGERSGAYAVVREFGSTVANGYTDAENSNDVRDVLSFVMTSNNNSSITHEFDTGPMKSFIEDEPIVCVQTGQEAYVGNVVTTTSNVVHENVYTRLIDSLIFKNATFGTITRLSDVVGGAGYSIAPKVVVRENDIAALGINESYLTLRTDDANWNTGNTSFLRPDSNDRLVGTNSGAIGDIKGGYQTSTIATTSYANGSIDVTVRVWQRAQQRSPGNIAWEVGEAVNIESMNQEYIPYTTDTRTPVDTGTADIISIIDNGILGDNARVASSVGANGVVTTARAIDSGFGYKPNEVVKLVADRKSPDSEDSIATGVLTIDKVANTEGYYSSQRSHLSSLRGYIQDNEYYSEYAYEINSALPFDKYKEVVLKLVHPAGQGLFSQYRLQSNLNLNVASSTDNNKLHAGNGTVSFSNASFNITGAGTKFTNEYANGDLMTVEISSGEFITVPLNIVSSDTTANSKVQLTVGAVTGANITRTVGSI